MSIHRDEYIGKRLREADARAKPANGGGAGRNIGTGGPAVKVNFQTPLEGDRDPGRPEHPGGGDCGGRWAMATCRVAATRRKSADPWGKRATPCRF